MGRWNDSTGWVGFWQCRDQGAVVCGVVWGSGGVSGSSDNGSNGLGDGKPLNEDEDADFLQAAKRKEAGFEEMRVNVLVEAPGKVR